MEDRDRPAESLFDVSERVAIFREDKRWFGDPAEEADERGNLRLARSRGARRLSELLEERALVRRIAKRQRGQVRRFVSAVGFAIRVN